MFLTIQQSRILSWAGVNISSRRSRRDCHDVIVTADCQSTPMSGCSVSFDYPINKGPSKVMSSYTQPAVFMISVIFCVAACSDSSTKSEVNDVKPMVETDDSLLLEQLVFPESRMADYHRCEYDRMSIQATSQAMSPSAMSNWVIHKEVSKLWCKATGDDAGFCNQPAFSLLENPGTVASYLKSSYAGSNFPNVVTAEVQQVKVPSAGEPSWIFTYNRRVVSELSAADGTEESFSLTYQNLQDDELVSIPFTTGRYSVEGTIVELPRGSGNELRALAASPEDFQIIALAQIDELAALVNEHILQNFADDQAQLVQSEADEVFMRQRELLQLNGTYFHELFIDLANPVACAF